MSGDSTGSERKMSRRDSVRLYAVDLAAVSRELSRLAQESDQMGATGTTIDSGALRELAEHLHRGAEWSARQLGDADLAREVTLRRQAFQAWALVATRLHD